MGARDLAVFPDPSKLPLVWLLPSLNLLICGKRALEQSCSWSPSAHQDQSCPRLRARCSGPHPKPFPHPAGKPIPPSPGPQVWNSCSQNPLGSPSCFLPGGSPSLHKLHPYPEGAHFLKPAALSGSNRRPSISSFLTNSSTSLMFFFRSSKSLWTSCNSQREE